MCIRDRVEEALHAQGGQVGKQAVGEIAVHPIGDRALELQLSLIHISEPTRPY